MQLKYKTIVLTGAAGGIGREIATALAALGATLVLVGRHPHKLASLRARLGKRHRTICADLATDAGRETVVSACRQMPGGIDILINNAGISEFGLLQQQPAETIEQLLHLNLTVPILLCQKLLPLLQNKRQAAIVNIGSTFGSIGYPGFSTYCASKFGLRGFTEALRRELADTPLRVIYLAPRATRTHLNSDSVVAMNQALGNAVDTPHVVAAALLQALHSNHSHDRYIGWPERLFVRINGLLPQLVDNNLLKQLPVIRRFASR